MAKLEGAISYFSHRSHSPPQPLQEQEESDFKTQQAANETFSSLFPGEIKAKLFDFDAHTRGVHCSPSVIFSLTKPQFPDAEERLEPTVCLVQINPLGEEPFQIFVFDSLKELAMIYAVNPEDSIFRALKGFDNESFSIANSNSEELTERYSFEEMDGHQMNISLDSDSGPVRANFHRRRALSDST